MHPRRMEVESEGLGATSNGNQPPGKPPETQATFKEKVLGTKTASEKRGMVNLVQTGKIKVEFAEGNSFFPMFSIDPVMYAGICRLWQDRLVVKLLGKNIGYGTLCAKLKAMWKPTGGFEVRDVHHGYYLVKFDLDVDRERAISGAPWLIFDHYLLVKPWAPDFVTANSKISTTLVWIRIPGLGFQFYDEDILTTLASAVGTLIKIDANIVDMRRGITSNMRAFTCYARSAVVTATSPGTVRIHIPRRTRPRGTARVRSTILSTTSAVMSLKHHKLVPSAPIREHPWRRKL